MTRALLTLLIAGCTVPIEPVAPGVIGEGEAVGDEAPPGPDPTPDPAPDPGGTGEEATEASPAEGADEEPPNEGGDEGEGEGEEGPCVPGPELCNQRDDDCDGQVDEAWADLGEECRGAGACGRGSQICDVAQEATCCSAVDGCSPDFVPGQELCDGVDNDCNGVVDDEWGIGEPCPGLGICEAGVWECDGPDSRVCSTLPGGSVYAGSAELCNGVDDDCDNALDEHSAGMGEACADGIGRCRRGGFVACVDGVPTCDAVAANPRDETCNVVDDDCDGVTDELGEDAIGFDDDGGCGECEHLCPIDQLPDDTKLCFVAAGNGACPQGWREELDGLSNGEITGQVACSPCDCGAEVAVFSSFGAVATCDGAGRVSSFVCGPRQGSDRDPVCDSGCRALERGGAGHYASMTIVVNGGGVTFRDSQLEGGRDLRLCCTDELRMPDQCGAPVCRVPGNAGGYLLVGSPEDISDACRGAEGVQGDLYGGVEAVGSCEACTCEATLIGTLCNHGDDPFTTCTAEGNRESCETDGMTVEQGGDEGGEGVKVVELTHARFQVERLQHGRPPDITECAGCHPIDPIHVCNLDAGVIE